MVLKTPFLRDRRQLHGSLVDTLLAKVRRHLQPSTLVPPALDGLPRRIPIVQHAVCRPLNRPSAIGIELFVQALADGDVELARVLP